MTRISLSVHDFVDLLLRKGDIDNRIFNTISMEEGSRLHKWYQDRQGDDYHPEVSLAHEFACEPFILAVEGRADGIIIHGNDSVTVDEIKTANADIDVFYKAQKEWHLGQALVYAYIYLLDHGLSSIKVQLTYISQADTTKIRQYLFIYGKEQLQEYIDGLLKTYVGYLKVISSLKEGRQLSLASLSFPFSHLRPGQQAMMDFAAETVRTGRIGFCEAPTGIGKTVSALFPYLKALQERNLDKIFYLTAKNPVRQVAYDTLAMLERKGARLKAVVMTSKEHICLNSRKRHCNPDECPFAKGYYDKANGVIFEALKNQDLFREDDIVRLAAANGICPFELQLDLLNYADVVIGDYNYLFDPAARLIRFFQTYGKSPFLLLIDEAHNLPDRVRDMFSSVLSLKQIREASQALDKKRGAGLTAVRQGLRQLADFLSGQTLARSDSPWEEIGQQEKVPDALTDLTSGLVASIRRHMRKAKSVSDELLDLYYELQAFNLLPAQDGRFAYYFSFEKGECLGFSISCLDPRFLIRNAYGAFEAGMAFSATLTPKDFFLDLLGGDPDSPSLYLPSPFESSKCLVMTDPYISTRLKDRPSSLKRIADDIMAVVSGRVGNYFVFFPSFEYMMKIKPFFDGRQDLDCYYQAQRMNDRERQNFLAQFRPAPTRTALGFIVLGGIFAEGIDLADDRLIGAVVVSVGLPKMSYLSDRIMAYFGHDSHDLGYAYAYIYPGLSRVFQAAGRVIRSEKDRGVILYIDSRYDYSLYKTNLGQMYDRYVREGNPERMRLRIRNFWGQDGR